MKEQAEKHQIDAVNSVFNVVTASSDRADMEKLLTMIVALGIAILRGLKGDEYVEDYLTAAIKDKSNVIGVEEAPYN
jgi:hypothetical protein